MSEKENSNNEPDQIISVNPEAVVENIKETSIWLRLVLVLIFLFVYNFMVDCWHPISVYHFYKKT